MNSDNALGCMWTGVLAVCLIIFASFSFGAPVLSGAGLSWDNSAWINQETQRTERERIQAARDIRIEQERGEAVQAFVTEAGRALVIVAVVVGAAKTLPPIVASLATAIASAFAAWAARPHRPAAPPATVVMLAAPTLQAEPQARLEWSEDDGVWVIVNDRTMTVRLLTDGQHRS